MKEAGQTWDSNTITPGTPFMFRLANALQYYIHQRLNSDPAWQNIMVRLLLSCENCAADAFAVQALWHVIIDRTRMQALF